MERLSRLDTIRVSKLLEIIQAALISLYISIYVGSMLDELFKKIFDKDISLKEKTMLRLISETSIHFIAVVLIAYYVGKITSAVPFMFSLNSEYIPNKKNETGKGVGMGTKIIFFLLQTKLKENLVEITKRIREYI